MSSRSTIVKVPLCQITDSESFHDVFSRVLGFPSYYGRNMDAWVDSVSDLDSKAARLPLGKKGVLTLALEGAGDFRSGHPELWDDLIDSTSDVNFRRIVHGEAPLVALAYC